MKFWFGRKAGRDGARPFLWRGWAAAPSTGDWPRSYEAQVREGYLSNPIAQRAVRLVAESVAWAPVYEIEEGAGPPPPRSAPSPSPSRGGSLVTASLLETVASQLLLHGNAFVQLLLDASGEPAELFALRPERVKIEADSGGWPVAYLYKAGEAKSRLAARDGLGRPSVAHIKSMHPLDDHYGLGCLGAAAGGVAVHNAAARWNKALLDNAARPSGALLLDPGKDGRTLSAQQFEQLRSEVETQFAGGDNAGRPMLLEGGLRWEALSLSPADMDFAGLKAAAAREIALAFGVPPMLLGLPGDSTYANYREANRALWRLTVLPLAEKILSGIGAALRAWWPGARLAVDSDQISALSEDRERLWTQVSAADFLTRQEKREMLGFDRNDSTGAGQ
ncbi:phage portal protein [Allosphingosinicella sp.]|jgi:HK97 family phage portal protein|uniref:phage portal protein n=1 Tax=Allosphingosinicella sp. TaxID=2823234 RepID=UPI002F0AF0E2